MAKSNGFGSRLTGAVEVSSEHNSRRQVGFLKQPMDKPLCGAPSGVSSCAKN